MSQPLSGRRFERRGDDRGATLVLVLILVIVGSLVVVPMLQYSVTVGRANRVLTDHTVRSEAVKAQLRGALANTDHLLATCGAGGVTTLDPDGNPFSNEFAVRQDGTIIATASTCELLTTTVAGDDVVPTAASVYETWASYTGRPDAPAGYTEPTSTGLTDPSAWHTVASADRWTSEVWLPDVPAIPTSVRSGGVTLPSSLLRNGYTSCTVYYPGTYEVPVGPVVGPAFFASGVYAFDDLVEFSTGADAVAGMGTELGCTDDFAAAEYAESNGFTHNIDGLGATFVLRDDARLTTEGSAEFRMNERFADVDDDEPVAGRGVSLMTVNGDEGSDLSTEGRLSVPASESADASATGEASDVIAHPPEPYPPTVTAWGANLAGSPAIIASWDPPPNPTGEPVTGYTVTTAGGATVCSMSLALGCALTGLASGDDVTLHVQAHNMFGASAAAVVTATADGPLVTPPSQPETVALEGTDLLGLGVYVTPYHDAIVVEWTPPADDGGAPITGYRAHAPLILTVDSLAAGIGDGTLLDSLTSTLLDAVWDQICLPIPIVGGLVCSLTGALNGLVSSLTQVPALIDTLVADIVGDLLTEALDEIDGVDDGELDLGTYECTTTELTCTIDITDAKNLLDTLDLATLTDDLLTDLNGVLGLVLAPIGLDSMIDLNDLVDTVLDNLLGLGVAVNVTAENVAGESDPHYTLAGLNIKGSSYAWPGPDPYSPYTPEPVVDLAGGTVQIPGHVSVPQGIVHTGSGQFDLTGGVLAAYIDADPCATCTTTIDTSSDVQWTLRIITETDDGGSTLRSDAVVQINANGAWAIRSWEVQ